LYVEDRYGVTPPENGGSFTFIASAQRRPEFMDRRGNVGDLSSNTYALTVEWNQCEEDSIGVDCEFDESTEQFNCTTLCLTMTTGIFNVEDLYFTEDSFYGGDYETLDWSNSRNLSCAADVEYPRQLSDEPVDGTIEDSDFCQYNRYGLQVNVASRMTAREALSNGQAAYFVCIVVVQWADLLICKTRMNSIREQGMLNFFMNFGLIFETICAVILCYTPYLNTAIGFRPLRFLHWMPGVPYSFFIFAYDEIRKFLMRRTSYSQTNPTTGQSVRVAGWIERNSYY